MDIKQLYTQELLDITFSMALQRIGIQPENLKREGISVSIRVPYPIWCSKEEALQLNKQAYESIDCHRNLFMFASVYGMTSIEELETNPYSSWYIWVIIKDRSTMGKNRLVLTHGHTPDREEAYYRANTYDEFWHVVEVLTKMYEGTYNGNETITLQQNNGMWGSSHRSWEITLDNNH